MVRTTRKKEPSRSSSEYAAAVKNEEETIKFIDGARPGRKVLIFDGHIFYFHSIKGKSTYFKCSHKHKGCSASITVKDFDKKNCSYDSFIVAKREHLNHLPSQEEIQKKEERAKQNLEKAHAEVDSEEFRNSMHVCLFCLVTLPRNYLDITSLENVMPSGQMLSISLDDAVKNAQSFDLLCNLLNIKWRRNQEGKYFDQGRCLPLCHNCQTLYLEMVQLNLQIRELEVLLNKYTRAIRDEICKSEDNEKKTKLKGKVESTQLALLGLHVFRKKVVVPAYNRSFGDDILRERESPNCVSTAKVTKSKSSTGTLPSTAKLKGKLANRNRMVTQDSDILSELPTIKLEVDVDQTIAELIDQMEDDVDDDRAESLDYMDNDHVEKDAIQHGESSPVGNESASETEKNISPTRRVSRRTRASTKSVAEMEKGKNRADEKNVHQLAEEDTEKADDGDSDYSDDDDDESMKEDENDSDSEFEVKKSSRKPKVGKRFTTRSSGRRCQTQRKAPYPSAYKPKKVNACHMCSFTVIGHKAFMEHYKTAHPDDPLYTCKFCRKQYEILRDVVIHQRRHTGERPFQCQSCPSSYVSSSHLRLHVLSRHKKPTFPCPNCVDKEFSSKILLNNHLTAIHGEGSQQLFYRKSKKPVKSFTCHLCDAEIMGAGPFLQHYRDLHPEEKRFTCKFCKRHFPYIRQVLTHQRKHTGEMPFACSDCDKCFISERNLRYHRVNTHAEREKVFACPICPKKYPLKQSLTGHMYSHREYIVVCKMCGKTFRTQNSFHKHNRIIHNGHAEPSEPVTDPSKVTFESLGVEIQCKQKCHVCMIPIPGKVFIRKHFAEAHSDHPGDEKTCGVCGQQFKTYKEVFKHAIRKHAGDDKPFHCEQCPYTCITMKELRTHSNTHVPMEERHKNHICSVCGLGFASNQTLAIHAKKHEDGDRTKFVCELCGKAYAEQRGLKHHMKTNHFKILPHKCHYEGCGKAFPLRATLVRHLNVHTGEHSYKCSVCDKNFHYEESRRRHLRKVHDVDMRKGQPRSRKGKKIVGGCGDEQVGPNGAGGRYNEEQKVATPAFGALSTEHSFSSAAGAPLINYVNAASNNVNYHYYRRTAGRMDEGGCTSGVIPSLPPMPMETDEKESNPSMVNNKQI